jgi:hypothetical protein
MTLICKTTANATSDRDPERPAQIDYVGNLPAGSPKPDCSERPQDQFWADARSVGSPGCNGFFISLIYKPIVIADFRRQLEQF